jgi:phosphatidylinositol glycan class T
MRSNLQLLHGVLPHEVVCTENLTPFLKLLPCKGKAGIASLLDGHKLFDASFQVMAIDVRPICSGDESTCLLEIEQTVDMVLDLDRSKRPRGKILLITSMGEANLVPDNPIPRPLPIENIECDTSKSYHAEDSCYPLEKSSEPAWTLDEVFGRPIQGDCPITATSPPESTTVCINVTPDREVEVITDPPQKSIQTEKYDNGFLRCFKPPPQGISFNIALPEQNLTYPLPLQSPPLHAFRSITGYGQEHGGIQTVLTNPSTTDTLEVLYLESLPWYMKPYLHTLRSSLDPPSTVPTIKQTFYRPALDRHRGTHLELLLTIPPASTLTLTYDFEKAILRYTEYPPDANRGFDVASAVVRILPRSGDSNVDQETKRRGLYVRTTSLLLPLPTPDFSMPYNVIILTSTVMALGFGSIYNILIRRFVAADEVPNTPIREALMRILAKARGKGRLVTNRIWRGREKTE